MVTNIGCLCPVLVSWKYLDPTKTMLRAKRLVGCLCLVSLVVSVGFVISWRWAGYFSITLILLEALAFLFVHYLRREFQWLITPRDMSPEIDPEGLRSFIQHGYDPELGWVRKPSTEKEERRKDGTGKYRIDELGSRSSPGHEGWPQHISLYGDSFAFGRQVSDNEVFTWHLSEKTGTHVLNFAVGNYGLDQAILRLKREYPRYRTPIVVIGVVPSTIVRILSVWKHYNEYGNTLGFKPRFVMRHGTLELIRNFVDEDSKFLSYRQYLPEIQRYDPFYEMKFQKDMLCFPYIASIMADPSRNIPLLALVAWDRWFAASNRQDAYPMPMSVIMKCNLKLRVQLFRKNEEAKELMRGLVEEFASYGTQQEFSPVFLWMPQKDDVLYVARHGDYYGKFISYVREKMPVIDLTPEILRRRDLDNMYSDDSRYGGHLSAAGNEWAAEVIYRRMEEEGILKPLPCIKEEGI